MSSITPHVLEMILENWGMYVTFGSWGPVPRVECGSVERQWNSDRSRYVWDDRMAAPRQQCNDSLGMMAEKLINTLEPVYTTILLRFYGYKHANLCAQQKALLNTAKVLMQQKLEEKGYE